MSRYIDADALEEAIQNFPYGYRGVIKSVIAQMPTADVVEVVRCKDCKYRPVKEDPNGVNYGFNIIYPDDENERCPCIISDGWYSWMPRDNWFCANGERKETEDADNSQI